MNYQTIGIKKRIDAYHRKKHQLIVQHEVGHYIVAKILGFEVNDISIVFFDLQGAHQGGSGLMLIEKITSVEATIQYLENRIIVLYAGALAQTLQNSKANIEEANELLLRGGSQNDYAKIRELTRLLRNLKYPKTKCNDIAQNELDNISDSLFLKALKIIEKEANLIVGVSGKIESETYNTNEKLIFSKEDLDEIPIFRERFPKN